MLLQVLVHDDPVPNVEVQIFLRVFVHDLVAKIPEVHIFMNVFAGFGASSHVSSPCR